MYSTGKRLCAKNGGSQNRDPVTIDLCIRGEGGLGHTELGVHMIGYSEKSSDKGRGTAHRANILQS